MKTAQRKSRKGFLKGIPKPRTVFGRRRVKIAGTDYIIEMRADAIHVRGLFSKDKYAPVNLEKVVVLSAVQLPLISSIGEDESKRRKSVEQKNERKENGSSPETKS